MRADQEEGSQAISGVDSVEGSPCTVAGGGKFALYAIIQPLQLLQARELFEPGEHRILLQISKKGQDFLHDLVKDSDWHTVIRLDFVGRPLELALYKRKILSIVNTLPRIQRLVVSSYENNLLNYLNNLIRPAHIILLEDGLISLNFGAKVKGYRSKRFRLKSRLLSFIGIDIRPIKSFEAFTIFSLTVEDFFGGAISVRKNSYAALKCELVKFEAKPDPKRAVVLLQNYIELNLLPSEYYIALISEIVWYFRAKRIACTLSAHRFNNKELWTNVARDIECEVVFPVSPIELSLAQSGHIPGHIATTGSGATYSLALLYDAEITLFLPSIKAFKSDGPMQLMIHDHLEANFHSEPLIVNARYEEVQRD